MGQVIRLPSREECQKMWATYATPSHICDHIRQVNGVACMLASALIRSGKYVKIDLVDRASLLHDLVRVTEWESLDFSHFRTQPHVDEISVWNAQRNQFPPSIPHAKVVSSILSQEYPEVAKIIACHSLYSLRKLRSIEDKIVYYADRRVAHSMIVSIHDRLTESAQRYRQPGPYTQEAMLLAVTNLESELFFGLDITPEDLQHAHEYTYTSQNAKSLLAEKTPCI